MSLPTDRENWNDEVHSRVGIRKIADMLRRAQGYFLDITMSSDLGREEQARRSNDRHERRHEK